MPAGLLMVFQNFMDTITDREAYERDVYLVYTRWRSEDDFQAWVNSPAFQHGHKAHSSGGPVGTASELWSFDVIQHEDAPSAPSPTAERR